MRHVSNLAKHSNIGVKIDVLVISKAMARNPLPKNPQTFFNEYFFLIQKFCCVIKININQYLSSIITYLHNIGPYDWLTLYEANWWQQLRAEICTL